MVSPTVSDAKTRTSIGLKDWHRFVGNSWRVQVLVAVPQRFCRSIFLSDRDPAETIRESIRLYAPVFCKWLQGAAPSLDLRAANLHLLDWARLFTFLEDVPEVMELHVRGEVETIPVSSPRSSSTGTSSSPLLSSTPDSSCILSDVRP
jgi:hypothetical protein